MEITPEEAIKAKMEAEVEKFNNAEKTIRQADENLRTLVWAREQLRGKIIALKELLDLETIKNNGKKR